MPQCNALSNHMCVTVANSWRPCCRFNTYLHVDTHDTSFFEYKASDFYQKIINDMTLGWAAGCRKCQSEEQRGQRSLRQKLNKELSGTTDIEYIEISLSNNCNLACKMCSPTYSTTWASLLSDNPKLLHSLQRIRPEYHQLDTTDVISVDHIFTGLNLSKLKKIKYLGGEPFVTPEIKTLFEYLIDNRIIQNIEFECNTNCTLFPNKWLKYLDQFKKVSIELSIDGVGPVNDFVRWGKSTWDDILPNIHRWAVTDYNINIFSTVQAYNLHDMQNVKALADSIEVQHYSSLLVVPEYLSVHVLPEAYLAAIYDDYNKKYYPSIKPNDQIDKFKEFTYNIDNVTGLKLSDVIPVLHQHMENYFDLRTFGARHQHMEN